MHNASVYKGMTLKARLNEQEFNQYRDVTSKAEVKIEEAARRGVGLATVEMTSRILTRVADLIEFEFENHGFKIKIERYDGGDEIEIVWL